MEVIAGKIVQGIIFIIMVLLTEVAVPAALVFYVVNNTTLGKKTIEMVYSWGWIPVLISTVMMMIERL